MGDKINLANQDAVTKLQSMAKEVKVCMFCTYDANNRLQTAPMSANKVDDEGVLWFIREGKQIIIFSREDIGLQTLKRFLCHFRLKEAESHHTTIFAETIHDMTLDISTHWFLHYTLYSR